MNSKPRLVKKTNILVYFAEEEIFLNFEHNYSLFIVIFFIHTFCWRAINDLLKRKSKNKKKSYEIVAMRLDLEQENGFLRSVENDVLSTWMCCLYCSCCFSCLNQVYFGFGGFVFVFNSSYFLRFCDDYTPHLFDDWTRCLAQQK